MKKLFIIMIALVAMGCGKSENAVKYQLTVDSLNVEYNNAYNNVLRMDSLFWDAKLNNDLSTMKTCADSTKYYTRKMIRDDKKLSEAFYTRLNQIK